jgi:hypothetical protein
MAKILEAHVASEEMQWLGMRKWMEDRKRKWDAQHKDDLQCRTGILDVAMKILAGA